ncbi:MAG TPA: type II toxin-antitoxin system Phd/YefM family antitoxin [Candidatus Fraserbacteria bacterium]|nr:type II toxin-antitoxin system Phd/YefM family antitoxin [Candidatus Fraserbacteria bacterium]
MNTIKVAEARTKFSDLMARVAYGGERIIVMRRNKPMMAWISIEDLRRLEALGQGATPTRDQRQAALILAASSRHRIRVEREGVSLPDSAELLTKLREERARELTGLH